MNSIHVRFFTSRIIMITTTMPPAPTTKRTIVTKLSDVKAKLVVEGEDSVKLVERVD